MIGQTLGHYRIVDKIGTEGTRVAYRAHDEQRSRCCAQNPARWMACGDGRGMI